MHLFMVYVGGYTENANVELHDMRFVVGETIEDCYPELIKQWWGDEKMFHLDAWGAVKSADGYNVSIGNTPAAHPEKLYFVNLGGYDPDEFTELHKNVLVVAKDDAEARVRAKAQVKNWTKPHRDKWFDVEKVLAIASVGNHHIHLEKTDSPQPFAFTCTYKIITYE